MTHSLRGPQHQATTSYPYLNNNNKDSIGRKRVGDSMGSSSRSEEDDGGGPGPPNGANSHLAVPPPEGGGGSGRGNRPYSPVAETHIRKDLISAMRLPDNEPLAEDDYLVVADTWKQEWEKGVQVPAKPEELKEPHVSRLKNPPHAANRFQL